MKKGIMITLITAAGLVALGVLILAAAFLMSGSFDSLVPRLDPDGAVQNRLVFESGEIDDLNISAGSANVNVERSSDDRLTIVYSDIEYVDHYVVDRDGGSLSLTRTHELDKYLSFGYEDFEVYVYMPADFAGTLDIRTSSGSTLIGGGFNSSELTASATSGRITADDCNISGSAAFESTSGRIELGAVSAQTLSVKNTSGKISVDGTDAQSISLRSSSGGISGTLAGLASDYTIKSSTTSGHNGLSSGGSGPRQLTVSATSGSIDIEFEG